MKFDQFFTEVFELLKHRNIQPDPFNKPVLFRLPDGEYVEVEHIYVFENEKGEINVVIRGND